MRSSREAPGADAPAPPPRREAPIRALYVHVPYCRRICPYCDFAVHALGRAGPSFDEFLAALELELALPRPAARLTSIYLGGGTPSALPARAWNRLAGILAAALDLSRVGGPGPLR